MGLSQYTEWMITSFKSEEGKLQTLSDGEIAVKYDINR